MTYRSPNDKVIGTSVIGPHVHVKETLHIDRDSVPPTAEECLAQVERLVRSPLFLGSEALCKLLKYLANHSIHTPTEHLKEYQIATEVFGRRQDFDPQTDSYVRVQLGRLRAKLTAYYEVERAADTVIVEVPKGRHILLFERRGVLVLPQPVPQPEVVRQPEAAIESPPAEKRRGRLAFILAAIVLAGGLGAAGFAAFHMLHTARVPSGQAVATKADMLTTFWSPFLQGPEEPIVVFANANFVGNAESGMRYYEPARDPHAEITQHYTGVGEVMGVLELDRLLQGHGRQFHVKRSSLFTLDDARNNNLIFVGSPTENLTLGEIPGTQEFVFHHAATGTDRWQETIINSHPLAGESDVYTPTDVKGHEGDDFAVVALRHGLNPARWTMILAGASTIGTQAAVDYVCDPEAVENLLKRLNVSKAADLKPFEALLRVKVINDVPLAVELTAVRQTER